MDWTDRFRTTFVALAAVGVLGAGAGLVLGLGLGFVVFCGVVGLGALVVLRRGEPAVAPVLLAVGVVAVLLAITYGVRDPLLGLLLTAMAAVAFVRGYQYHQVYST